MRPRLLSLILAVLAIAAVAVAVALAKTTPATKLKAEPVKALGVTVLADTHGRTLYRLKPETPKHLLCTSSTCLRIWLPFTVRSKKKAHVKLPKGYKGKVGFVKRGKRFQITVRAVPVYTFVGDSKPKTAVGNGIKSFGGTWHVLKVKKIAAKQAPAPSPPMGSGY